MTYEQIHKERSITIYQCKIMQLHLTYYRITSYQWLYWHIEWLSPSRKFQFHQTHTRTLWTCLDQSDCRWWYWTVCTDILMEKHLTESGSGLLFWNSVHLPFWHTIQSPEITTWNVGILQIRLRNSQVFGVHWYVDTYSARVTTDLSFTGYLYYCSFGKLSTWRIIRLTRDPHSRHLHHGWFDWIKIKNPLNTQFWMRWDLFNLKLLM